MVLAGGIVPSRLVKPAKGLIEPAETIVRAKAASTKHAAFWGGSNGCQVKGKKSVRVNPPPK